MARGPAPGWTTSSDRRPSAASTLGECRRGCSTNSWPTLGGPWSWSHSAVGAAGGRVTRRANSVLALDADAALFDLVERAEAFYAERGARPKSACALERLVACDTPPVDCPFCSRPMRPGRIRARGYPTVWEPRYAPERAPLFDPFGQLSRGAHQVTPSGLRAMLRSFRSASLCDDCGALVVDPHPQRGWRPGERR